MSSHISTLIVPFLAALSLYLLLTLLLIPLWRRHRERYGAYTQLGGTNDTTSSWTTRALQAVGRIRAPRWMVRRWRRRNGGTDEDDDEDEFEMDADLDVDIDEAEAGGLSALERLRG